MIVCPVCEHAQPQGGECEVCGKRLTGVAGAPPLSVAPLEGLEETSHAPAAAAPGGPLIPELEPTRAAPTAAPPPLAEPPGAPRLELEPTRAAPVRAVADVVPDLERTLEAPVGAPTALPAVTVCRYCRTPAGPADRLCGRCGMRLPRAAAKGPAPAADAPALCSCGTPITGSLCPSCGARNTHG